MRLLLPATVCCALLVGGCTTSVGVAATDAPASTSAPTVAAPTVAAPTDDQLLGLWGADLTSAGGGRRPWLRFEADWKASGYDGCNWFSGSWTLDPQAVDSGACTARVDERRTTLVGCSPSRVVVLADMRFDGQTVTYEYEDGSPGVMTPADAAADAVLTVGHCVVEPLAAFGRRWSPIWADQVGGGQGLPDDLSGTGTVELVAPDELAYVDDRGGRLRLHPSESDIVAPPHGFVCD